MTNWRQWGQRTGAYLRRFLARMRRATTDDARETPPAGGEATAVVRDAGPQRAAEAAPQARAPSATPAPAAAPSTPAPAATPAIADKVPPATEAGEPAAKPARAGTWSNDSITALTGSIDLAPWVLPVRTYRIYEPVALADQPSVLVVLHGCRQTADDIAEGTRLNEHADERGWLVVYPEQAVAANKYGCWNWFDPANARGQGECALVVAMLDAVRARYGLERAPTFLAGMSAGGALASLLALHFPDRWAAVAIHSGLPFGAATDIWGAKRAMREGARNLLAARALRLAAPDAPPVPALILHGNEDDVVHRINANLLVRQFLGWNGYFTEAEEWEGAAILSVEDRPVLTRYGHPYILRDYRLPDRAPVRECEVVGMGHAWSGGDAALPYHDELGPDASALMVEFCGYRRRAGVPGGLPAWPRSRPAASRPGTATEVLPAQKRARCVAGSRRPQADVPPAAAAGWTRR
ncbi:MAG: PHB depolymerase family esterase [Betaproteobacteria bacterium]|nr:PHB depolymerase family esterase [Betaproteobacteria bacterium]